MVENKFNAWFNQVVTNGLKGLIMNAIEEAVNAVGGRTVASLLLGISYVSVRKMEKKGVLPRTDYTGETNYAHILAKHSNGKFTKAWLLDKANPKHSASPVNSNQAHS